MGAKFIVLCLAALSMQLGARACDAQGYPSKPVRIVVGFSAGGASDIVARLLAVRLSEAFGQSVIVENVAGAGGALATARVAKAPADGYTLLTLGTSDAIVPALRPKLPYQLQRDLAPVSMVAFGPSVVAVHPSLPVRSAKELIALAKARPGKLSYGSQGVGSSAHMTGELFNLMAKVKIVHVPYKGGSESVIATATGEVEVGYLALPSALPLLDAGKIKVLAVTTKKRWPLKPSIPTLDESGLPGYELFGWQGIVAPANTPKDVIGRLHAAITRAVSTPEMKDALNKQGREPWSNTPEEFAGFIQNELEKYARIVKAAGVQAE